MTQLAHGALRSRTADASRAATANSLLHDALQAAQSANAAIAAALFRQCLEVDPTNLDGLKGLGDSLKRQGDSEGAVAAYRRLIALRPDLSAAHIALAEVLRRQGHLQKALDHCELGLTLDPAVGEGHVVRAIIRKELDDADGAIADLRLVVAYNPYSAPIYILLGGILGAFDRVDEAVSMLQDAIALVPQDASLHEQLSRFLVRQRKGAEALAAWEAMLALKTGDAESYRHLATLYLEQGRKREAFDAFQKALEIDPKFVRAYVDLATLLMKEFQLEPSASIFRFVTLLTPDTVTAWHNLGVVLRFQGQLVEAAASFRKALAILPDAPGPLAELFQIKKHFCEWNDLEALQKTLWAATFQNDRPVAPFTVITSPSSPEEQLHCARVYARSLQKPTDQQLTTYAPRPVAKYQDRIRLGYVSSDFFTHATAMLMAEMVERHDRTRFELIAYSFGPDDGSALRARLVRTFERFVDLRGIAHGEAARRIHDDDIDILIDLKGYTQDAHTEVFAYRPAPIQVNFLGYPGTMGADFIDYILIDSFVVPTSHAPFYDEKLVHLPHCYQPNDRQRPIADETPSRQDCNLPEDAFVFCCFNNTYKITADVFAIWMRLLQATPGAVLWLLEPNASVAANLHREAASHGIAADRIIFAPRLPAAMHLARFRIADLFLDTLPVNAHTTASEALWVGLPVLTCAGETFIGRVAGSLLSAIGLPDLVTTSLAEYEAKALQLAHDRNQLARLRTTLAENRLTFPLFDTDRYIKSFEAALLKMTALRDAGSPPKAFAVADQP